MQRGSLISVVETVLRESGVPLSARAIAAAIQLRTHALLGGRTPWKTVGARLAVEIRSNPLTPFMRVGRGLYALREWDDTKEVIVPARKKHPLDEDILAVPVRAFEELVSRHQIRQLLDIPYRELLDRAVIVRRAVAEETEDWVQLIPSFLVFRDDEILSFKRTRKTPEQRLHDTYSIVFGGHLQADDSPGLFANEAVHAEAFLFRELHEELAFEPPYRQSLYAGVLHLNQSRFERQHAGVVFVIDLAPGTIVTSWEPGYHSTLRFVPWSQIEESNIMQDRWSATCIEHLRREPPT